MDIQKKDNKKTFPWNLLLKYQLIEIIVLWEGRLTANHLVNAFAIGRQQGSKIIAKYKDQVAPGNLVYDQHIKGYKPTVHFKPVVTNGSIDEYMHLINSNNDLSSYTRCLNSGQNGQANTEVIFSPARFIVPEYVRPIIIAARDNFRLDIQYLSLTSDIEEGRVITPHTLVYSGYRWHVRAHCEKHNDYRDFVLSRINDIPEPVTASEHNISQDISWNTQIILKIIPDPRLSSFQQNIISREYAMLNGVLEISTRAALANYHLQYLRITPDSQAQSPEA
ncbi:MAG: WYL domain-containing protein, partial [Thiotrichaceae bacterium]|nr:WYL domain-containing protein [Thiotrichaceae bacterium]